MNKHNDKTSRIIASLQRYQAAFSDRKLRFDHGSSNSTRNNDYSEYYSVDISDLNEILEINRQEKYAYVEPNVAMDSLLRETLKHNLIPLVIPEFPGITVGGAVQGAALESSSFKYGQFNDTCEEFEVILSDGSLSTVSKDQQADIYYGMSGSYGTLGLLSLAKVKLIEVPAYVRVDYLKTQSKEACVALLQENTRSDNDFVEGLLFRDYSVVMLSSFSDKVEHDKLVSFSKASDPWFYRHAQSVVKDQETYTDYVPIYEYLFRYNIGAFWMGDYMFSLFGMPNNKLTRTIFNPVLNTRKLYDGLHKLNISQDYFIQDIYFSYDAALKYLDLNERKIDIYPVWLCPIKASSKPQYLSPHYHQQESDLLNIGLWGASDFTNQDIVAANREVEAFAQSVGGRKMLYAQSYYSEQQFWEIYDHEPYMKLRGKHDRNAFLANIYDKVITKQRYKSKKFLGAVSMLFETLAGKNVNN